MQRLAKSFIPTKPFPEFKWKWASLQCTEGLNDPVVLLGVLFRIHKLEGKGLKYSSDAFADELRGLSHDIKDTIGINLVGRTGERNIIRNSGQYWKALGLIPTENRRGLIELTPFGRMVASHEVSQSEFSAITIQTLTLPNPYIQSEGECELWKAHSLTFRPLALILQILLELHDEKGGQHSYLTAEELQHIVIPLSGVGAEVADYANFITWSRRGEVDIDKFPDCCPAANDGRIAREFLLFLANYGYVSNDHIHTTRSDERFSLNVLLINEIREIVKGKRMNSVAEMVERLRSTAVVSEVDRKRAANRPNQSRFRKEVLEACKCCVVTNVSMPEVLEAAHIKPYKYKGEDTIANDFAMRTDIHLLFDTGHLRISPDGIVELSQVARLDYGATIPHRIFIPDFTNREFLRWRWENYNGY